MIPKQNHSIQIQSVTANLKISGKGDFNTKDDTISSWDGLPCQLTPFEGRKGNYREIGHWHECLEIYCVQKGRIRILAETEEMIVKENSFTLVNAGEVRSIEALEENQAVVFRIPEDAFETVKKEGEEPYFFMRHHPNGDDKVIRLLNTMCEERKKRDQGCLLKMMSLFYELLYLLIQFYLDQDNGKTGAARRKKRLRLSKITEYMNLNYDKPLPLDFVAAKFGVTPQSLSRMFFCCTGVNYKTYLEQLRVEHGYQDLISTDLTIQDLAIANGFPNCKAFTSAFKSRYGYLPSEYRKMGKNGFLS